MGTLGFKLDIWPHRVLKDVVVHVKVGRVRGGGHLRDVGRLCGPDVVPVDAAEERVALEVGDAVQTQTAFPGAEQPLDQIFSILRHVAHMGGKLETILKKPQKKNK